MQNFARLLSCRDDKEKLFSALQYMCDGKGKKYAYGVWDGDQLTKAEMRINGCASGEYMSYTRVTRLLGIYDRNGEYGSVEEAVDALKKKGYTVYTDNALETIVLYDDADTRQQFREEGKIRGIRYGANNLSKQITAKMNKEGKIDIEIAYGEQYSPRYNEYNLAPAMEIDNIRYNELKLKALDFQLQKVRMKKAALQEKMRGG